MELFYLDIIEFIYQVELNYEWENHHYDSYEYIFQNL